MIGTVQERETIFERESVFQEIHTALRHTAVYGLGSVLAKALGFLMLPFYLHYLTPMDYGLLEILDLSMSLFGMVLHMGIAPALLRRYCTAKTIEDKKIVVSTAFLFVVATAVIAFVSGLGLLRPVSLMLFGPKVPVIYLLLSFGSFACSYISNLSRTYLRALEKSGLLTTLDTVALFIMLGLNIYFIAVLKLGPLAIVLSPFLVGVAQVVLLSGWILRKVGVAFNGSELRQMVRFGLPLILSNLAIFALNFSDRFFLQHLRSLDVVGIYAVGYKFAFMINYLLVQPFYFMWQARMYVIHEQPQHEKIFSQIFVLYALVLTYAALALSMFSPEIVRVMAGPRFLGAQAVIPLVALSYVFCGIGHYVQLGMFLANRTRLIGFVSVVAGILNLGLNYTLISRYGMVGAAWATLLSFVAIAVGSYCVSQSVYPLRLGVGRVLTGILLSVCVYLVGQRGVPGWPWATLAIKGLLLASFPILLWKLRILSAAEIGTVASLKDRTLARFSSLAGVLSWKAAGI